MCSGQGDVHITCAPLCTHAVLVAGGTTLHSHPAVPQEMLMSWWLSCWWPGGGLVVASPRGIMLMWWWGCGGVLCAVGMWEVMWGGVGLAPVLPWSSPPPGHLLLLLSSSLCSCAPVGWHLSS